MSVKEIEEILEGKNSFYRISKPMGTWELYTLHSNNPIKLEIFQNFNKKGSGFSAAPLYSANLQYSDERMIKVKGHGGMWIGLSGHSIQDILSQAMKKIEDFYDPKKIF
ncbi:MAG: hypothetical protein HY223_03310 [Thaumarchaeota archaeon]|nr:hypothetical protein [Nitrososphaerota archaeon]